MSTTLLAMLERATFLPCRIQRHQKPLTSGRFRSSSAARGFALNTLETAAVCRETVLCADLKGTMNNAASASDEVADYHSGAYIPRGSSY